MTGVVTSVNLSPRKGMRKTPVEEIAVRANYGIEGDAHASGTWHRQVSLLAEESIEKMRGKGLNVSAGDFAENITTRDIDLVALPVGTRLRIGADLVAEVSQIGKHCHARCEIYRQAGDCVMPTEGIFVRVVAGGSVRPGDSIVVEP